MTEEDSIAFSELNDPVAEWSCFFRSNKTLYNVPTGGVADVFRFRGEGDWVRPEEDGPNRWILPGTFKIIDLLKRHGTPNATLKGFLSTRRSPKNLKA